jgi:hypothetical protein
MAFNASPVRRQGRGLFGGAAFGKVEIAKLGNREVAPGLTPIFCGVAPRPYFPKQSLSFFAGALWRPGRSVPSYRDAPRSTLPPSKAELHEIDLAADWGDFQTETGKVGVPKIRVTLTRLDGINRSFCDLALCHFALPGVLTVGFQ